MILKVELEQNAKNAEIGNGWRFIDEVDNLESRYRTGMNSEGKEYFERELLIFRNDVLHEKLLLNNQQAYLLNGEGKTIERIN